MQTIFSRPFFRTACAALSVPAILTRLTLADQKWPYRRIRGSMDECLTAFCGIDYVLGIKNVSGYGFQCFAIQGRNIAIRFYQCRMLNPLLISSSTIWLPRKPSAPVTQTFITVNCKPAMTGLIQLSNRIRLIIRQQTKRGSGFRPSACNLPLTMAFFMLLLLR